MEQRNEPCRETIPPPPNEPQPEASPQQQEAAPGPDAKDALAVAYGRKGGQAGRGKKKARPHDQASKAARARWDKQKRSTDENP